MDGDNVIDLAAWKQMVRLPDSRYNEIAEAQGGDFEGALSFLGQTIPARTEVFPMNDATLTKGEFDAHIRRLDDRISAMEETILSRLDRVVSEMSLRDEARTREFNIRDENREKEMERVYESIQHSIEITRSENKNTRWTMLALTVTILAGVISAIAPIGWQIFREIVK